jgi:DNA-binding response OmpR family regulator
MSRILVIDDDMELCELLTDYLRPEGFDVESVQDAGQGIERALSGEHALVVLDVMLPGISGFDVLRQIRDRSRIPVLMLTARGDDVDRIVGLEMGADDYLPKPFNPRELVARIRAVQRRTEQERAKPAQEEQAVHIAVGDVELDVGTRRVVRGEEVVELTAVEFNLLQELLLNAGTMIPRAELVRKVLGRSLSAYDRSIDVHISSLRKKLGHEVNGVERIKTIRSMGYLYTQPSGKMKKGGRP